MKDKNLKKEVHAAVRDYLSTLINERSQPGKGGMAVTSHDLMVAAKTAGQKCKSFLLVRSQSLSTDRPGFEVYYLFSSFSVRFPRSARISLQLMDGNSKWPDGHP